MSKTMNLKKSIFAGTIFLSSLNLFSQDKTEFLTVDLNDDTIKDSLFWKRSEVYTTEGYFPKDYVDYQLFLAEGKTRNNPKEIYKFSYQVRNGKIPLCPKLNFREVNSSVSKVEFWETKKTKRETWYPKIYHDQYNRIEINFQKPEICDTFKIKVNVLDNGLQKYISPSEFFP